MSIHWRTNSRKNWVGTKNHDRRTRERRRAREREQDRNGDGRTRKGRRKGRGWARGGNPARLPLVHVPALAPRSGSDPPLSPHPQSSVGLVGREERAPHWRWGMKKSQKWRCEGQSGQPFVRVHTRVWQPSHGASGPEPWTSAAGARRPLVSKDLAAQH